MRKRHGVPVREWQPLGDTHVFNQANEQASATETDSAAPMQDITVSSILGKALLGNARGLRDD